ncbi:MAG: oligosaccharide flippase family protein [Alphaproteobacteria bacterium]|uniref:Oligosaccharide flippase family protein n=1 Tax=Candidatus Nitrobium versatile TaxID=2884831 RepID=A0A953J5Y7_9BACT|nr:oligosaccharide flippase family protein [Candidatus Nitrobium versatile]
MKKEVLGRNFLYTSGAFLLTNLFGYLFHAVASRKLGPPLYAEFTVLYTLLFTLSRPVPVLATAVARVAVLGRGEGRDFGEIRRFSFRLGTALSLGLGLGTVLLAPLFEHFLHAGNRKLFLFLGLTLFIWGMAGIYRGLLVSLEHFRDISYADTLEMLVRAACGSFLLLAGFGSAGAFWSVAAGALVLFVLVLRRGEKIEEGYTRRLQNGDSKGSASTIAGKVFLIALPVGLFTELDTLLIKRLFSPDEAGMYAAAALIGKGLLLFSVALSSVLYPRLVEGGRDKRGLRTFLLGVKGVLLLFCAGFLFLLVAGEPFIALLFGPQYRNVAAFAPWYLLSLTPLALHLQIANYKSAIGGRKEGLWLWGILAGYFICLEAFSSTLSVYLYAIFLFHSLAAPLSFLFLYRRHRGRRE